MNNSTEENTARSNDNNFLEDELPLELTIATYAVIVLGFCANSFICFAFACYRRIRTVHNYFVLNLAISDLLLIISLCLFQALPAMEKTLSEEEGGILAQAFILFEVFCGSSSIANLTIISYDRYYSVTKPLHYTANITRRKAALFIVCIWGYALVVALLQLLYFLPNEDYFNYGYIPLLGLFNSVLPLAITLYCYITIFIIASSHLRNNPHRSQDPNAPTNILTKNLKISFHILVLVAPLLVCWSSYYAITVIEVYCVGCIQLTTFENWVISMMAHFLAAIDPIIYIFLTKDFRKILFGCFKSGNRPYSVSETFHLSTTKSTNSHAMPATGSETRIIDEDQMAASSYRRS
ncbi:D(5)-like dopamine receptor [Oculina patagonica]